MTKRHWCGGVNLYKKNLKKTAQRQLKSWHNGIVLNQNSAQARLRESWTCVHNVSATAMGFSRARSAIRFEMVLYDDKQRTEGFYVTLVDRAKH